MFYNQSGPITSAAFVASFLNSNVKQIETIQGNLLGWNVPMEHTDLVHPYWRSFLSPPKYCHILLALIYFILLIMSWVGNGCVVWIFSTSKCLRTPSNLFIINLAIFDLIMTQNHCMLIFHSFTEHIIGWRLGCDIYAAFGAVSGIGSAITHAAIAFDRYRAISCPIDGRLNGKQAVTIVFLTWFWSMPFTILPVMQVWGRFTTEGFLTTCSFDFLSEDEDTKVFVGAIFTWAFCIPACFIIYFYSQLMKSVKQHEKMLRDQARKMNVKSLSNQDKERNVEMRIAKVAITIFFLFMLSFLPYATIALTGAFGNREFINPYNSMIPAVFTKLASSLDPWVYAISHPRYRQELTKRCKWLGVHEPEYSNTGDVVSVITERVKSEDP